MSESFQLPLQMGDDPFICWLEQSKVKGKAEERVAVFQLLGIYLQILSLLLSDATNTMPDSIQVYWKIHLVQPPWRIFDLPSGMPEEVADMACNYLSTARGNPLLVDSRVVRLWDAYFPTKTHQRRPALLPSGTHLVRGGLGAVDHTASTEGELANCNPIPGAGLGSSAPI